MADDFNILDNPAVLDADIPAAIARDAEVTVAVAAALASGPFAPTITGAVAGGRYVGVTAAVAPTTGTFLVGDWVTTRTGLAYACTVAGTPGTWVLLLNGAYVATTGNETIAGIKTFSSAPIVAALIGASGANLDLLIRAGGASGATVIQNSASTANNLHVADNGAITLRDGATINQFGASGTKIGGSSSQKFGFFGATPVVQPTGIAVTAAGIHAALVTLGLITA
jgi:hypothetical protein